MPCLCINTHFYFLTRHCFDHYFAGATWQFINPGTQFPYDKAVRAGRDADGSPLFVGRAFHEGDMLPAKVSPSLNLAYVSYGGAEVELFEYEILRVGDFAWEFATNGEIPEGAVEIGRTLDGEKLYSGRAIHSGTQTPGKVQASHGCLYIPFGGEEVALTEYEVLVMK